MEAKKIVKAEIMENRPIATNIMQMRLQVPEVASLAQPGQFVNV